jgi:hypothetical protein
MDWLSITYHKDYTTQTNEIHTVQINALIRFVKSKIELNHEFEKCAFIFFISF